MRGTPKGCLPGTIGILAERCGFAAGACPVAPYTPYARAGVGRTVLSPTRSGPEGSSRNDFVPGRSGSHLFATLDFARADRIEGGDVRHPRF